MTYVRVYLRVSDALFEKREEKNNTLEINKIFKTKTVNY